jgi:hypothetical protein
LEVFMILSTRDGAYGNAFHSSEIAAVVPRVEKKRLLARQQLVGVAFMAFAIAAIAGLAAVGAQKYAVAEVDPTVEPSLTALGP